jgi:hypothetical protein
VQHTLEEESLGVRDYFLPPGYKSREAVHYFVDDLVQAESVVHQPDVYPFAAEILRRVPGHTLLDIGCGRAQKLAVLHREFQLIGVDCGDNLAWCRSNYNFGQWREHNFERGPMRPPSYWDLSGTGVICSDVIEHLIRPDYLLETFAMLAQKASFVLISTPERDLARGPNDLGPPANPHHAREWNLDEFKRLLGSSGLHIWAAGLTNNNSRDRQKKSIAVLARGTPLVRKAPSSFTVTAIVCTFNEADVIQHTLDYLTGQGIRVIVLDNWSTDSTVEKARQFAGRGLVRVEQFPATGPTGTYDWHRLLSRVEEIATEEQTDWVIHHDADEIRQSPWPELDLRSALYQVDLDGYNCIDHICANFQATAESEAAGACVPDAFQHFEFGKRPGHFLQKKAWKKQPARVALADSGGHDVNFPGRRVYPLRFLLRHYPIRSQEHGQRKVIAERLARFNPDERESRGWHSHYDALRGADNFLRNPAELLSFDANFETQYLTERLTGVAIMPSTTEERVETLEKQDANWTQDYQLISDVPADDLLPWLDRQMVDTAQLYASPVPEMLSAWREHGVLILENFIPKDLREQYFEVRQALGKPGGWSDPCPYLYVPELRELSMYPPLLNVLDALIGYEMGLHLNLTGWVTTGRAWHQDDYLNPDFVNSHYAAVWIALRDISADCGPFEFVPGSHKWPLTRRDKVLAHCPAKVTVEDPAWPSKTQDWVSDIIGREIENQGAKVERFLAKEGDVLIWHGRLAHRGSLPAVPGTPRHSMIAHYSAIEKRSDMNVWKDGCFVPDGREGEWK